MPVFWAACHPPKAPIVISVTAGNSPACRLAPAGSRGREWVPRDDFPGFWLIEIAQIGFRDGTGATFVDSLACPSRHAID
jgi:hypothetical protein